MRLLSQNSLSRRLKLDVRFRVTHNQVCCRRYIVKLGSHARMVRHWTRVSNRLFSQQLKSIYCPMPHASREDWEIIRTISESVETDSDLYDEMELTVNWHDHCLFAHWRSNQGEAGADKNYVRQNEPRIRWRNPPDSRRYSTRRVPQQWNLEELANVKWQRHPIGAMEYAELSWADGKCQKKSEEIYTIEQTRQLERAKSLNCPPFQRQCTCMCRKNISPVYRSRRSGCFAIESQTIYLR